MLHRADGREEKFREGPEQERGEFSPELAYELAYDPPTCATANEHQDRFRLFCGKSGMQRKQNGLQNGHCLPSVVK